MTTESGTDPSWSQLAGRSEAERIPQMQARFSELAALPEQERRARLGAMLRAEYALPDDLLRAMTVSRLRAFLSMPPAAVHTVVNSLNTVTTQLPGSIAMRRVSLVQTLARDFSLEDQHALHTLMPGVFGDAAAPIVGAPQAPTPTPSAAPKKPWWAFWRN